MTYCLAIATRNGLVFCSDSRTNAGPDMLSSYSKMHIFAPGNDRLFVVLAAGNLATTQSILSRIEQDMQEAASASLMNCTRMIEAARYVSALSHEETQRARESTAAAGIDTSVTLIFGGQIAGNDPAIYLVYKAGNFITDSDQTPFLQIGESKFGKPILDRILTRNTSLEDAARCAIVSMDSTIKSNATVGPPIEVLVYEKDSYSSNHYIKMEDDDEYLRSVKKAWNDALKDAFSKLPPFHWENRRTSKVQAVNDQFPPARKS
jgi:putative proteasome-type protease